MKRLALLGACVLAVAETYRRGYVAPLLFGCRQWRRAQWRHSCVYAETELEIVG